jgi:hypothetical protein
MSVTTFENTRNTPKTGRKNIWSIDQVAPCPHNPMHAWVVQILEGHFEEGSRELVKPNKHKSRVIYAKMTESGKLENVHQGTGDADE